MQWLSRRFLRPHPAVLITNALSIILLSASVSACYHYRGEACSELVSHFMLNRSLHLYFEDLPCTYTARCPLWKNGTYEWGNMRNMDVTLQKKHFTKTCADISTDIFGSGGTFVKNNIPLYNLTGDMGAANLKEPIGKGNWYHWQPQVPGCRPHTFSPREVYECLKGKRMVIHGDSMMRQTFTNLVWQMRGIHKPIVPILHFSSYYTMDGRRDSLQYYPDLDPEKLPDIGMRQYHNASVMELMFNWMPKRLLTPKELERLKPDIYVVAIWFWARWAFGGDDEDSDIRKQLDAILASKHRPSKILFLLTPVTDEYAESGLKATTIRARNHKNIAYLSDLIRKRYTDGSVMMVPTHTMAEVSPWKPVDETHYQCIIRQPLRTKADIEEMELEKKPKEELAREDAEARDKWQQWTMRENPECWDPWNTALVQHLLNLACLA